MLVVRGKFYVRKGMGTTRFPEQDYCSKMAAFLKFPLFCLFPFVSRGMSFRRSSSVTYLTQQKTIVVTGINLATDVDHPYHGYKVCITFYRFSASFHCSLSRQAPWRKVKFVVSAEKLASALFAEEE